MTADEQRDIKARALLRYHEAKCEVACHRKKISEMGKQLSAAAQVVKSIWEIDVILVDDQRIVRSRTGESIYPAMDELAAAVESYRNADSERMAAERECQSLGITI